MTFFKRALKAIFDSMTTSRLTDDEVLTAIDITWRPITGDRSIHSRVNNQVAGSEEITNIELDVHLNSLQQKGLIEIEMRHLEVAHGLLLPTVRQCRMTELGVRRRAGIITT